MFKQKSVVIVLLILLTACDRPQPRQSVLVEVFPPQPIDNAALSRINDLPITPGFFQDRWTLVLFGPADCAADCQARLQLANRQQALQSLFVVLDLANISELSQLAGSFPEVAIGMATTAASADNFNAQFAIDAVNEHDLAGFYYLVNPHAELEFVVPANGLQVDDFEQEIQQLVTG